MNHADPHRTGELARNAAVALRFKKSQGTPEMPQVEKEVLAPDYDRVRGGNLHLAANARDTDFTHPGLYLRKALPDRVDVIERVIADGDRVGLLFRVTATHTGGFFGVPPSGKRIDVYEVALLRLANGQMVEGWFMMDEAELLRQMVREDLLPLIDLEYSARLILGKAGRSVTPAQLQAFSDAMSSVLINRYADGLLEFRSNEQLEVLPMKGENSDKLTRVRTRVKLANGGFAPVDYAFRKTEQGWKAFDVTVEGISYVITFRNQIVPRVEADGIDKVTADILAGNLPLEDESAR